MPALDVTGTLGLNDGEPDGTPGSTNYENYYFCQVALSIDLPLGFRKDKANYASALLSNRQKEIALENAKNQVILSVRKTLRDTRAAHKSYQAAILAGKLAEQSMEVEEGKFKNGLSTSYNVLLYQRDLSDAKSNEVAAAVNYQLAVIELNKAVGITLEKNNIKIKEALK